MARLLDREGIEPHYAPARPGEIRHSRAAIDKAWRILGYEPLIDFQTGLAATLRWYQQQRTGTN